MRFGFWFFNFYPSAKLRAGFLIFNFFLMGCNPVSEKDREFVYGTMLIRGTNCIHLRGSGGGGMLVPGMPAGGGFGQGSISAAHSEDGSAKLSCGADGAKVEGN
jgi:hypothetical protein